MDNDNQPNKSVLIIGGGGFVGGFMASEGLRRGYSVTVALRASTSRQWLTDPRLRFLVLDFENPAMIAASLRDNKPAEGRWDYVIYNLGATKCLRFKDFNHINYEYLQYFTTALKEANVVPEKLLFMSSLSAMGPVDEKGFRPIKETDIPQPNTRYGASKLKAEMWLATSGIPVIIFRATGIYGPRDHDYFLMLESISKGVDFTVGFRRQMLTFIYVEDLCRAAYDALEKAPVGRTYIIAEDRTYSQAEFRKIASAEIGKKFVIGIKAPLWMLKAVCSIAEKWGAARNRPSTLNSDKYNILKQRNWNADISAAKADFGFSPRVSLQEGIRRSVAWYREQRWLK